MLSLFTRATLLDIYVFTCNFLNYHLDICWCLRLSKCLIKLEFHDADTDTDTDIITRILARKSRISDARMYRRVGRVGVGAVECELY